MPGECYLIGGMGQPISLACYHGDHLKKEDKEETNKKEGSKKSKAREHLFTMIDHNHTHLEELIFYIREIGFLPVPGSQYEKGLGEGGICLATCLPHGI